MSHRSEFSNLLRPRTVAVAGMSSTRMGPGNRFVTDLIAYGFDGELFAIHPSADAIDGIPAYPRLADVPQVVDYAYIAVPAETVLDVLSGAGGNVRFAQVMSSGFSEESAAGAARERTLQDIATRESVRVLGPNCLGTFSPRGRLTFVADPGDRCGGVSLVSQSGGLALDLIGRGKQRGLAFNAVVTVGNAADVDPVELLEYFAEDEDTSVIGLYLESTRRGRELFQALQSVKGRKPVVLLKGGMTAQGAQAAASHTGALLHDERLWSSMAVQTGLASTETVDEFIDVLNYLQHESMWNRRPVQTVALVGNGGGSSVLGTDAFVRNGLSVSRLEDSTIKSLDELNLPPGTSVVNPVDLPAGTILVGNGRIVRNVLSAVASDPNVDAIVVHLNLSVLAGASMDIDGLVQNLSGAIVDARRGSASGKRLLVVLRSDGSCVTNELQRVFQEYLFSKGIAVVREIDDAARVVGLVTSAELSGVGLP